jgi:hypothetical protein
MQIILIYPDNYQIFGQQAIRFRWETDYLSGVPFYLKIYNSLNTLIYNSPTFPVNLSVSDTYGSYSVLVTFVWAQDAYHWYVQQGSIISETRYFTVRTNCKVPINSWNF